MKSGVLRESLLATGVRKLGIGLMLPVELSALSADLDRT